jgi:hypothetical protein
MARGLKKHLKRLNAPKHWMLDKLGGVFAPKPSTGACREATTIDDDDDDGGRPRGRKEGFVIIIARAG